MNKSIMPKKTVNDYIFYKIVCLDNSIELCYVGSTADFTKRRYSHKNGCNNENNKNYNNKLYTAVRENGGWENFKMIQIGTREQLTKREAEFIEEEFRKDLKSDLNSKKCFTSIEERKEYVKNWNALYKKEYNIKNEDKIKEQRKKYYEKNSDKLMEKSNNYYEKNKDKIKEKLFKKVECECGCMVSKTHLSRHKKTDKHLNIMKRITAEE